MLAMTSLDIQVGGYEEQHEEVLETEHEAFSESGSPAEPETGTPEEDRTSSPRSPGGSSTGSTDSSVVDTDVFFPTESVKAMAESVDVEINEEAATLLSQTVMNKLRHLTLLATQFSRHSKSDGLRVSDFTKAEKIVDGTPSLGYGFTQKLPDYLDLGEVSVESEGPEIDLSTVSRHPESHLVKVDQIANPVLESRCINYHDKTIRDYEEGKSFPNFEGMFRNWCFTQDPSFPFENFGRVDPYDYQDGQTSETESMSYTQLYSSDEVVSSEKTEPEVDDLNGNNSNSDEYFQVSVEEDGDISIQNCNRPDPNLSTDVVRTEKMSLHSGEVEQPEDDIVLSSAPPSKRAKLEVDSEPFQGLEGMDVADIVENQSNDKVTVKFDPSDVGDVSVTFNENVFVKQESNEDEEGVVQLSIKPSGSDFYKSGQFLFHQDVLGDDIFSEEGFGDCVTETSSNYPGISSAGSSSPWSAEKQQIKPKIAEVISSEPEPFVEIQNDKPEPQENSSALFEVKECEEVDMEAADTTESEEEEESDSDSDSDDEDESEEFEQFEELEGLEDLDLKELEELEQLEEPGSSEDEKSEDDEAEDVECIELNGSEELELKELEEQLKREDDLVKAQLKTVTAVLELDEEGELELQEIENQLELEALEDKLLVLQSQGTESEEDEEEVEVGADEEQLEGDEEDEDENIAADLQVEELKGQLDEDLKNQLEEIEAQVQEELEKELEDELEDQVEEELEIQLEELHGQHEELQDEEEKLQNQEEKVEDLSLEELEDDEPFNKQVDDRIDALEQDIQFLEEKLSAELDKSEGYLETKFKGLREELEGLEDQLKEDLDDVEAELEEEIDRHFDEEDDESSEDDELEDEDVEFQDSDSGEDLENKLEELETAVQQGSSSSSSSGESDEEDEDKESESSEDEEDECESIDDDSEGEGVESLEEDNESQDEEFVDQDEEAIEACDDQQEESEEDDAENEEQEEELADQQEGDYYGSDEENEDQEEGADDLEEGVDYVERVDEEEEGLEDRDEELEDVEEGADYQDEGEESQEEGDLEEETGDPEEEIEYLEQETEDQEEGIEDDENETEDQVEEIEDQEGVECEEEGSGDEEDEIETEDEEDGDEDEELEDQDEEIQNQEEGDEIEYQEGKEEVEYQEERLEEDEEETEDQEEESDDEEEDLENPEERQDDDDEELEGQEEDTEEIQQEASEEANVDDDADESQNESGDSDDSRSKRQVRLPYDDDFEMIIERDSPDIDTSDSDVDQSSSDEEEKAISAQLTGDTPVEWASYMQNFILAFFEKDKVFETFESFSFTFFPYESFDEANLPYLDNFQILLKDVAKNGVFPVLHMICEFFHNFVSGLYEYIGNNQLRRITAFIDSTLICPVRAKTCHLKPMLAILMDMLALPVAPKLQSYVTTSVLKIADYSEHPFNLEVIGWVTQFIIGVLESSSTLSLTELTPHIKSRICAAIYFAKGYGLRGLRLQRMHEWVKNVIMISNNHHVIFQEAQTSGDQTCSLDSTDSYLEEAILDFIRMYVNTYQKDCPDENFRPLLQQAIDNYGEKLEIQLSNYKYFETSTKNLQQRRSSWLAKETAEGNISEDETVVEFLMKPGWVRLPNKQFSKVKIPFAMCVL